MRPNRLHAAVAAAMLSVVLVGCGNDKPPVCDSLASLQHSVNELKNTNLSQNGVTALRANLAQVRTDLTGLAVDAKDQFQQQVATVQQAVDKLSSAAGTAKSDPTAATLQQVGASLTVVADSVRSLGNAMSDTC